MARAGFSLSRAMFRKKCVGPLPGAADPIFPGKKLVTFLVITVCQLSVLQCHPYLFPRPFFGHHCRCRFYSFHSFTRVSPIISPMLLCCKKKLPLLLWWPLFVGPLFGRTCWTCLNPPLRRVKNTVEKHKQRLQSSLYW